MGSLEIVSMDFKNDALNRISQQESYLNYPVIYLLNNDKEAYIGETIYFKKRMKAHLKNKARKNLTQINLIQHERFNRSATFHLETKLINYFLGDEKYLLQNKSKTVSNVTHNYYEKSFYDEEVFQELWQQLRQKKLVQHSLHAIENKDIFKLSPFKELSREQLDLKEEVLEFCENHIQDESSLLIIEGEAGVGKSVVLSSIFNTLQEYALEEGALKKTTNYLVVNHEEMLKTYKGIAKNVKHLKAKNIEKPTPLINRLQKNDERADIILVDEAHLLLTRKDTYNNFYGNNQLEELMKLAKIVIIVYDQNQVLKLKSLWEAAKLETLKQTAKTCKVYPLTNQFRMQANDQIINWIDAFKDKKLLPIPVDEKYEVACFDSLQQLHQAIEEKNKDVGLSRVVATFDFLHKKDNKTYYVTESKGDYQMPWNTTASSTTWAERQETIQEAGSIYTIQGFDLNYVGVVLGPSIQYDAANDCLRIDTTKYKDTGAYAGTEGIENVEFAKERIILNSLNILMKRGVHGLYIYAYDEALRERLKELKA